jgi:hypothetical protein
MAVLQSSPTRRSPSGLRRLSPVGAPPNAGSMPRVVGGAERSVARSTALVLGGWPVSEGMPDFPLVPGRVDDTSEPPSVLIVHAGRFLGTRLDGTRHHGVGIDGHQQRVAGHPAGSDWIEAPTATLFVAWFDSPERRRSVGDSASWTSPRRRPSPNTGPMTRAPGSRSRPLRAQNVSPERRSLRHVNPLRMAWTCPRPDASVNDGPPVFGAGADPRDSSVDGRACLSMSTPCHGQTWPPDPSDGRARGKQHEARPRASIAPAEPASDDTR